MPVVQEQQIGTLFGVWGRYYRWRYFRNRREKEEKGEEEKRGLTRLERDYVLLHKGVSKSLSILSASPIILFLLNFMLLEINKFAVG